MENAYRVIAKGMPTSGGVYPATTASAARYKAYQAAREAGYDFCLSNLSAARAYQYDVIAADLPSGGCSYDHAQVLLHRHEGETET